MPRSQIAERCHTVDHAGAARLAAREQIAKLKQEKPVNTFDAANEELNRLESSYRLRDPETASAEVQRIVEEEMNRAGINLNEPRENNRAQSEREREAIFAAAAKFKASRPETDAVNGFLPCEANESLILEYMQRRGMDFTSVFSFEEAFLAIRDRLIAPQKRHVAPQVRKVNGVEISHAALDRLSSRDLERLLQNPRIVDAINALPPLEDAEAVPFARFV
jgi:hypothetical protein